MSPTTKFNEEWLSYFDAFDCIIETKADKTAVMSFSDRTVVDDDNPEALAWGVDYDMAVSFLEAMGRNSKHSSSVTLGTLRELLQDATTRNVDETLITYISNSILEQSEDDKP